MREMEPASVDAIVTDPPYGLNFMARDWDHGVPGERYWIEALRVAKPGAHLLAFGGTRTFHRLTCAIEDAGWEIRDCLGWIYGSGFPKSLDVSKAIDKANGRRFEDRYALGRHIRQMREAAGLSRTDVNAWFGYVDGCEHWERQDPHGARVPTSSDWAILKGRLELSDEFSPLVERAEAEREKIASVNGSRLAVAPGQGADRGACALDITAPATDAAREWSGWGTALKPAVEYVIMAQKPIGGEREQYITVGNLYKVEVRLWLLLRASVAGESSTLSPDEYGEAFASAQWTASELQSTLADLRDLTDTSRLESAIRTTLNTVSSWRSTWEEALSRGSRFITETATGPIIDSKTLNSSASALTPQDIIRAAILRPGSWWSAIPAANILNAAATRMRGTLDISALESAIEKGHISRPGGLDPTVSFRPIILARAPLAGTVAATVCEHGTGALNIDACRVASDDDTTTRHNSSSSSYMTGRIGERQPIQETYTTGSTFGRWPANLIHDGSDEVVDIFPMQSGGGQPKRRGEAAMQKSYSGFAGGDATPGVGRSSGSAARFFYCAKASRAERGEGNVHPTVKPLALMRYLCRLIAPPGGLVLDPFAGSGSTLIAAVAEGFEAVGIEREAAYAEIARQRFGPLDQFAEATP